jgi:hypothetical protein
MAAVVFGGTYLVVAITYASVALLNVGQRARSFKAISPGMLPPLGIIFGLFVAFTAAQVWNDIERANGAVNREASALRAVVVLAASLPTETEVRQRGLVRNYIEETVTQEWPMMAQHSARLSTTPPTLAEALQLTLALAPSSRGQETAQREITAALENALDARRQRVIQA